MKKLFRYKDKEPIEVKSFDEIRKSMAKEYGVQKHQVSVHSHVMEDEEFSRAVVLLTKFGNIYALVGTINFDPEEK